MFDRKRFIEVASGRIEAELVLKNAHVVNVFTSEIIEGDIAIDQGKVAGIGTYRSRQELDIDKHYVVPSLIDAHVHIESSLVSPEQFARIVIPHGTTSVIADPHEIANVCGLDGIRYMIEASKNIPLDIYFMIPSCVPAAAFENAGAVLDAPAIETIIDDPAVLGLGEMMDYPSVVGAEQETLAKLEIALSRNKPIDGHSPMLSGLELNAYVAAGVQSDHECSTLNEMRERLRLGMKVLIREGSAARNLSSLITGINKENAQLCSFCTDDKQPEDIFIEGHIDHNIRLAIKHGLDPLLALQMATINTAKGYGLKGKGAIAPGYDADLLILDDLIYFNVRTVYKGGKKVAENKKALFQVHPPNQDKVINTVKLSPIEKTSLQLPLEKNDVHVIRIQPGSIITEKTIRQVSTDEKGFFKTDPQLDIRKIAVLERHNNTGNIGLGLVEGYGIKKGAIGTSIAHDSHNLVVIGDNDDDMKLVIEELVRTGGGISLAQHGNILETLALPIAGLMSNEPANIVNKQLKKIIDIAHGTLAVNPDIDPFMTLSFLTLPVIPELKITDRGLFDVTKYNFIDITT